MFLFLHFCPISLGHPRASGYCSQGERLHSGRDPEIQVFRISGEEPGKQRTRSCRAQELSRSRAQGKAWRKWKMDRTVQLASEKTGVAPSGIRAISPRGRVGRKSGGLGRWAPAQYLLDGEPSTKGPVVGSVGAREHRQGPGQTVRAWGIQRGRSRAEVLVPLARWPGSG